MKANIPTILVLVVALSACATAPPNTPGAGSGQTYTPVVDMQGVDPARYSRDLGECRNYAGSVDVQGQVFAETFGAALVAGLFSAALGGNYQQNSNATIAGGFAGSVHSGNRALGKQERIIINCMTGRGYRALDAAFVVPSQTVNQQVPNAPPPAAAAPQSAPAPRRAGEDVFNAERVAKDQSCAAQPMAALVAKGPGFESYTVPCNSGDTLMVRCEFGNCRALK